MLYEFHRKQNAKKPGTVHATYLLTGIRRIHSLSTHPNGVHSHDGEDTVMQSSPVFPSSSVPMQDETMEEASLMRTILLVKEEDLEQAKNTFDTISSIHIYSLEANALKDVQVLTECNRKVGTEYASEDPLEVWKQYGTIQNPHVKRRRRGTAPPSLAPASKPAEVKNKLAAQAAKQKEPVDTKADSKPTSTTATPEPEKKGITKPTATKRQNSDIFKSFSKAKAKPKAESQSSKEASPAPPAEDVPMTGFSDDEGDDVAAEQPDEEAKVPGGKSKNEREAELKAMMDAEDEEMGDVSTPAAEVESQEPEDTIDKADSPKEEEPKENVTVENGRRRGRRRVMKKKTVKDEEGYLGMYLRYIDLRRAFVWRYANISQSREKKQPGSPFQKTSRLQRRSKRRLLRRPLRLGKRVRRKQGSLGRGISCRSFRRSDMRELKALLLYNV